MKKMLTIVAFLAALGFSSNMLYARGMGNNGHGDGCGNCMGPGMNNPAMLEKDLNLTEDQADRIHKINMEFIEKTYQMRKEHKKAIEKVLTVEQKKKLEELINERHKACMKDCPKQKNMDARPMRMMHEELELTDAQTEQIHRINMDYADRFHKNRNMPDEIKKLKDSRDKDIEKILTDEQLKKFKAMREMNKEMKGCPFFPEE